MNEEDIVVEDNGEDIGISEETYTQATSETVEVVSQEDLNLSEVCRNRHDVCRCACMLLLGISPG